MGLEGIVSKRSSSPYRPGRAGERVGQDQVQERAGVRHRRLHRPRGSPHRFRGLAGGGARQTAGSGTWARWGPASTRSRSTSLAGAAAGDADGRPSVHRGSRESAEELPLGAAGTGGRGGVRRVDPGRWHPPSQLQRAAGGQARGRRRCGGAHGERDDDRRRRTGRERSDHHPPRPGLLAHPGRDQERPDAVLRHGRRAHAPLRPRPPYRHGALPQRGRGWEAEARQRRGWTRPAASSTSTPPRISPDRSAG